jgi:hypothetical protein
MIGTRGILDRATLVQGARMAESVGYSHLCIHDHLLAQMAPIPVLTAVAMATERLRLCPLVFNNAPNLVDKVRRARERWGINSYLVGWFDDAGLADVAPVVEQLAGT